MTASNHRDLVAQAVIVIAACIGVWFVFVEPRQSEAARLQESLSAGDSAAGVSPDELMESGLEQVAETKATLQAIQEASSIARDYTLLYELIMVQARSAGVGVQSVTPVVQKGRTRDDGPVGVIRIEALVDGPYESVASFVNAVCTEGRTIRLARLAVSPLNDTAAPRVAATVLFEAYAFELPPNLAALTADQRILPEEARHADPE